MSAIIDAPSARGLTALRRLASKRPEPERCFLCGRPLCDEHPHLIDPQNRRLLCACDACTILFDDARATKYARVPRDIRSLAGLSIDDGFWNGLAIPIGLVFFFRSTASGGVMAVYPSPAGPTETSVDEETWSELAALHPSIGAMRDDVEALLANRIRDTREYFIVPIDECYKLTGLIRRHWSGFTGGSEAWCQIQAYFDKLKSRAIGVRTDA